MIVPKLRFFQFKNHPAWSIDKLGNLAVAINERAGTKKYILMSVTSGVGLVPQVEKFGREIAGSSYKNYYVIKENDFAYNKSATKQFPEGYISMLTGYKEAALPNSIFTCFRIANRGCDLKFFDHLFQNNYHGSWLRKYIEVGGRAHGALSFNIKHLWDMPIALPRFEEQQKIADCLTSLDELIATEDKKLSTLREHKKGLMQKLFPTEGEALPEWRFPEFRSTGEWNYSEMDKEATIVMGSSPKSEFYNENNNGLPLIQGNADIKNRVSAPRIFTSQLTQECQIGDILISVRAPAGTVAMSIHHACIGRGIAAIRANKNNSQEFIYQWLFSFESQWHKVSQGGTFDAINSSDIRKLKIRLPFKHEQQKIANCLSSIDELIDAQIEKIETLKTHKAGLMQGLFLSIEEVGE